MSQNLDHELRCDNLITPQDVASATEVSTNTGGYLSMENYRKGLVIISAHLGAAATATAQLTCSTAATEAGKADVSGFTVTLTGDEGGSDEYDCIAFDVSDLDIANSKYFVGVDVTTDNNGDDVSAVLVRGAARYYAGSSMPS